jgi:hypothetical protein
VLQKKLRILSPNDLQEKDWLLSRILNSKDYCAESLNYSKKGSRYKRERLILLIPPLDSSPASIISILQDITEHKRSLPTMVCFNSLTVHFNIMLTNWRLLSFFFKSKWGTNIRSDERVVFDNKEKGLPTPTPRMKKLSLTIRKRGSPPLGSLKEKKKGGDTRWQ